MVDINFNNYPYSMFIFSLFCNVLSHLGVCLSSYSAGRVACVAGLKNSLFMNYLKIHQSVCCGAKHLRRDSQMIFYGDCHHYQTFCIIVYLIVLIILTICILTYYSTIYNVLIIFVSYIHNYQLHCTVFTPYFELN